jgi:hypothetical protein
MSWVRFPSPAPISRTLAIDCRPTAGLAFRVPHHVPHGCSGAVLALTMRQSQLRRGPALADGAAHVACRRGRLGVPGGRPNGVEIGARIVGLREAAGIGWPFQGPERAAHARVRQLHRCGQPGKAPANDDYVIMHGHSQDPHGHYGQPGGRCWMRWSARRH